MLTDKQKESYAEQAALLAEWLGEATPAEIDTAWLAAMQPLAKLRARVNELHAKAAKYRKHGGNYAKQADEYVEQADALKPEIEAAKLPLKPYEAEWEKRGGWTRAYLVPDGHIHKTTACHSLYPTTLISWLPEQSGWDEEKIVEAAGMMACTFCYPSAPVDALRAAAAAEKAKGECPGSRGYDHTGWRQTSYTGTGRARCNRCGQTIGTSTTGKLRAHKAAAL